MLLSTFALDGSEAGRPGVLLRYADLGLLALAFPVFVLADLPLAGYAAAALAWIAQHAVLTAADRAVASALARGDRRRALALAGGATIGRLWLVTLAILLVGLLGAREDGLAAAVLAFALVTVHLACLALSKLLYPEQTR